MPHQIDVALRRPLQDVATVLSGIRPFCQHIGHAPAEHGTLPRCDNGAPSAVVDVVRRYGPRILPPIEAALDAMTGGRVQLSGVRMKAQ